MALCPCRVRVWLVVLGCLVWVCEKYDTTDSQRRISGKMCLVSGGGEVAPQTSLHAGTPNRKRHERFDSDLR